MLKTILAFSVLTSSLAFAEDYALITCRTTHLGTRKLKQSEVVNLNFWTKRKTNYAALRVGESIGMKGNRFDFNRSIPEREMSSRWSEVVTDRTNLKSVNFFRTVQGLKGSYVFGGKNFNVNLISTDEDDFTLGMIGFLTIGRNSYRLNCVEIVGNN